MFNNMKKIVAIVLAMVLCMGVLSTAALAEGYDLMSLYPNPYEMSGHMMTTGVGNDIPQTLVIVPASNYVAGTLTAGSEALYCCDAEIPYEGGIYYKRLNLEDSDYYDENEARKIRAIVMNSYPFIPLEVMKQNLAADGFADANKLTRGEIISAVQAAIWYCSNDNANYRYSRTFDVAKNDQWGIPFHDYGAEGYSEIWWVQGYRQTTVNTEVGNRINRLRDYLLDLDSKAPKSNQVIISDLEILDSTPIEVSAGTFRVALRVKLNNSGSGASDNISIKILVDGTVVKELDVVYGEDTTFDTVITAKNGQNIKAVVSGIQVLPRGAYFYAPQGGRDASQSLVGVYNGATEIYADASITLKAGEFCFPKGGASNISYMLIDRVTKEVTFVKKVDLEDGDTAAPIIMEDGYISAMFIKQSTSGKFWIAEEVDAETVDAVIKCLIAHNPSYKGHDEEIAFGFGDHDLTYAKKNGKVHTITYSFND